MTQPVTYYVDHHITRVLCNTYGSYWEDMRKTSCTGGFRAEFNATNEEFSFKPAPTFFRAALSSYSLWKASPGALRGNTPQQELLIAAVEQNNRLLDHQDRQAYDAIVACMNLPPNDLENLIFSLSEQIRDNCWFEKTTGDSQL